MRKRKGDDYDVPELTARDFKRMRSAREVHPRLVESYERARGRPRKAAPKVPVTLRLDPEVAAALRASGAGWQTRTNAVLAKWVRTLPTKRPRA